MIVDFVCSNCKSKITTQCPEKDLPLIWDRDEIKKVDKLRDEYPEKYENWLRIRNEVKLMQDKFKKQIEEHNKNIFTKFFSKKWHYFSSNTYIEIHKSGGHSVIKHKFDNTIYEPDKNYYIPRYIECPICKTRKYGEAEKVSLVPKNMKSNLGDDVGKISEYKYHIGDI